MNITTELVAKLIFTCSQLRYFEQQLLIDPNQEIHDIVIRAQINLDNVLCEMGMEEYIPLKTILETLKLNDQFGPIDMAREQYDLH